MIDELEPQEEETAEREYYCSEAGAVRLTHEQEADLFAKYQAGDQQAGAILVESVTPWVNFVVKKQSLGLGWFEQFDERESAVNLAIAMALASFDPAAGKLTTHVYWQARAVCCRHTKFTQTVSTPVLNGDKEHYKLSRRARNCCSLDVPMSASLDGSRTLGETLSDKFEHDFEARLDLEHQRQQLRWALNVMGDRDAEILRMRFLEGLTLEETGKRFKLTRERIRQCQERALRRLKNILQRAPQEPVKLVDRRGKKFVLDGQLGVGSHREPDPVVPVAVVVEEEDDIMAGRTLTQLLRELTVADVDRELQQLEANCGDQIATYHADRRRLRLLRDLLVDHRTATPPSPGRPPTRKGVGPKRPPQMFPQEGTHTELIYKLLTASSALTITTIASRTGLSVGQVNSVLTRYRDRFFVQRKIGWSAISPNQVEANWLQLHGDLAASA